MKELIVSLDQKISVLSGIGEKRMKKFEKLGIDTIDALLRFYPRGYEDWSAPVSIEQGTTLEKCCVKGRVVTPVEERRPRPGMTLYRFEVSDGRDGMEVVLFNNRFLADKVRMGQEYLFYGRVEGNLLSRQMKSPQIDSVEEGERIHPIYRQTAGVPSKYIEAVLRDTLRRAKPLLEDPLPDDLRRDYQLCHLQYALEHIHFPKDSYALETAQRRLVFEELFYLCLGLMLLKKGRNLTTSALPKEDFSQEFYRLLPFIPTSAQRRAVEECMRDMQSGNSMNRLLQGDVGSGKTAVAACLIYNMCRNGFQSAMVAPTEILAVQHFHTLQSLLEGSGLRIGLLLGKTPAAEKRKGKALLEQGEWDVVVGTHAVFQKDVSFHRLGLIVTDEQHRFGVAQRLALAEKGENPHVLVMSATPIPRTLGLAIYSDLDISVLDELPKGRRPVDTYSVTGSQYRQRVYRYIKKHLDRGLQGYIVCPLVKENEEGKQETDLKAAEEYYETLRSQEFSRYRLGLLHGRMKSREKEQVMAQFVSGEIQLLISTVVIEVGVDVPKAVIMVIENAERFGLSQLHQLRGRVGRGSDQSTCILLSDSANEKSQERLNIIRQTTDGFRIAEEDLRLRGPGNFFGYRQHGLPELKIANMLQDMQLLSRAKECASEILERDAGLLLPEHAGLKKAMERLFEFDEAFLGKTI